MARVQDPLVVRIFINRGPNGWSERWPILARSWSSGLTVALTLAQARQRLISSNAQIVWVSLASIMPPYVEQYVAGPLLPLPQWGPSYFDMSGLLFLFTTANGHWSNHLFRAIDGTEIVNKEWIRKGLIVPSVPPALPSPVTLATKEELFLNTLATFRANVATCEAVDTLSPFDGAGFVSLPYENVELNQVSSRLVGRRWAPMSWEPQAYLDRPNFSPCGMKVTVLRCCYSIPCDYGQDGPANGIRYYFAKPAAAIFTEPTIFYGWARSKENVHFTGPGEQRKMRKTDWTNGSARGNAPGVAYSGYAAQFLGYGPPNYGGGANRPMPTMPVCDAPVIDGLTADDGFTWLTADDGATILTQD